MKANTGNNEVFDVMKEAFETMKETVEIQKQTIKALQQTIESLQAQISELRSRGYVQWGTPNTGTFTSPSILPNTWVSPNYIPGPQITCGTNSLSGGSSLPITNTVRMVEGGFSSGHAAKL